MANIDFDKEMPLDDKLSISLCTAVYLIAKFRRNCDGQQCWWMIKKSSNLHTRTFSRVHLPHHHWWRGSILETLFWFTFKILVIFPLSFIYVIAIWSSWVNMITTNYSNTHLDTRLSSLLTEKLLCSSARKSCFLAFGNCGVLTLKQTNKQTNNKI